MATLARRVAIGLAALGLLAAAVWGGAELLRARLEHSEALRGSVERALAAQAGVELATGELRVGFWPARLGLEAPVLLLPGAVRLELSALEMRVDAGELLGGVARIESVRVDGPGRLRGPRLELVAALQLLVRPDPASGAWRAEGTARLESGGSVEARGTTGGDGGFEGEIRFREVEAAPFSGLLTSDQREPASLAGRFDGRFDPPTATRRASLRLTSADARVRVPPLLLVGAVALVAELPAAGAAGSVRPGRFAIDASGARVEYAGSLARASGRGASVEGDIVRADDGRLRVEQVALEVVGFRGEQAR